MTKQKRNPKPHQTLFRCAHLVILAAALLFCGICCPLSASAADSVKWVRLEPPGFSFYSLNFGTGSQSQLNEKEQELYTKLKDVCTEIADGKRNRTEFIIDIDITGTYPSGTADEEDAIRSYLTHNVNIFKTVRMLLTDCPYELYWFHKSRGYTISYSAPSNQDANTFHISRLAFSFYTSEDFAAKNSDGSYQPYLVDGQKAVYAQAAKAAADQIVETYADCSDYEKLSAYRREICARTEYDQKAASSSNVKVNGPWHMISVFDSDPSTNAVCEGYSKAFAYLCEKSQFENDICCYIVTGELIGDSSTPGTGGGHMWNIVSMEDGRNYLVDITNCDDGAFGSPDQLFLTGCSGSADTGYTVINKNGQHAVYTYNQTTRDLFPSSILTLASTDYVPSKMEPQAAFFITEIPDKTYGDAAFSLSAAGGSGSGAIRYQVPDDNGVLTIDGSTAAIIGSGTVTITASKAGDAVYRKTSASCRLTVAPKILTPSITGSASKTYDGTTSIPFSDANTLQITLDGLLPQDQSSITADADYAFADAGAGTNKIIRASNITLSGSNADHYLLSKTTAQTGTGTIISPAGTNSSNSTGSSNDTGSSNGTDSSNDTASGNASKENISVTRKTTVNSKGRKTNVTLTTRTDAAGTIIDITKKSMIKNIASDTTAAVTIKQTGSGRVTRAAAVITQKSTSGKTAVLTKSILSQIQEAANGKHTELTIIIPDAKGNTAYKLKAGTKDLAAGNKLWIYRQDTAGSCCSMVNAETYTVSASGRLSVSMPKKGTYRLLAKSAAEAAAKSIRRTITAQKTSITLRKGSSAVFLLNRNFNKSNMKKITYASSQKLTAGVSKNGKITAYKTGTAIILAKVMLKNGSGKTVSMKVTVK